MSIVSNLVALLDEVGITTQDLDRAVAESAEVKQAVVDKAHEVRDYWVSIAPVNKYGDEAEDKPHTLKSGYVDEPGDYQRSIRIKYEKGGQAAKVYTNDYKARFI